MEVQKKAGLQNLCLALGPLNGKWFCGTGDRFVAVTIEGLSHFVVSYDTQLKDLFQSSWYVYEAILGLRNVLRYT
jgi:hypothetical protein